MGKINEERKLFDCFKSFSSCKCSSGETMTDYINKYEQHFKTIAKELGLDFNSRIMGYILLENSGLQEDEKMKVLSNVSSEEPDQILNQIKKELLKLSDIR